MKERPDKVQEVSSPACGMRDADEVYMGYAAKDEIVSLLNTLLEAERAGAIVTLETAHAATGDAFRELMQRVHRDEARWCAMLIRHISALGGTPSTATGSFYGKAMAITDLDERIAFLNRGQGWVVRNLREILPRVREGRLNRDLSAMLRSHEENIARTEAVASASLRARSDRLP